MKKKKLKNKNEEKKTTLSDYLKVFDKAIVIGETGGRVNVIPLKNVDIANDAVSLCHGAIQLYSTRESIAKLNQITTIQEQNKELLDSIKERLNVLETN